MESSPIATLPPDDAPQAEPAAPRKVFISYASEDRKHALRVARDLRAKGVKVWIDDSDIPGGDAWVDTIEEGLKASTEVVLILSANSRDSEYVKSELILAKGLGMRITPLLFGKCEEWLLTVSTQNIDFRVYEVGFEKLMELMKLPPPRWTWWRRILISLKKIWAFRPYLAVLALAIGIAAYAYFLSPSSTSFSVSGGDASGIEVLVRNRGGKSSVLLGSSFKLHFGNLPLEPEPLVRLQPEKQTRIAGHSDVVIRLTASDLLKPRMKDEESYFTVDDVLPLLANAKVTLTAQIKESDDRIHTRSEEFPAERIKNFVREEYPTSVP